MHGHSPDVLTLLFFISSAAPATTGRFSLNERIGPNGRRVLQVLPPTVTGAFPQPESSITITTTVNPDFIVTRPFVPLIYTVLSSIPGTIITQVSTTQLNFTFTCPADYFSAVITIAELGYVNRTSNSLSAAGTITTTSY